MSAAPPTRAALVTCLLLTACPDDGHGPSRSAIAPGEHAMPTPMQPTPELLFAPGPAIAPTAPLRAWLDAEARGGSRQVRLPVAVRFAPGGLGLAEAWIGGPDAEPPAEAIRLKLDDTTLGVALLDRLRTPCPGAGSPCAVWLDGYWGGASPMAELEAADPTRTVFTVRRMRGPVRREEDLRAHLERASSD